MLRKRSHHKKHHKAPHHDSPVEVVEKFIKKKIDLFYKITFSLLVIGSLVLAYFLILVSSEPKSIPFVTQKIESTLQKKFGDNVGLENSYLSFTRYGTLKIAVTSLKILYTVPGSEEKQAFVIPRLESEFSLFNFLLLRFQPNKIKIINPVIVVDDLQKLRAVKSPEEALQEQSQVALIIEILSSIRTGKTPIENFEIENAKLLVKARDGEDASDTEILIKRSQIRTSIQSNALHFSSVNKISFDQNKADVDLKSNCKLSSHDGLKCDLVLENFVANSIADLHPSLNILNRINATLNATASLAVKDGAVDNFLFKASAKEGDFEFLDFFSQKMFFNNFSVTGEYDNKLEALNLSEIKTDFVSLDPNQQNSVTKPHLEMSLLISDVMKEASKKLDFFIKLQNVPNDEMERFWPSALHENGVREWVISHVRGGMIRNAYAKFSLTRNQLAENNVENLLGSMDAQLVFSDLNLEYSPDFPALSNLTGVANFTHDAMKISITTGDVLKSKISDGVVAIDDFHAPVTMLKISGKSRGDAADSLKHAHNAPEFTSEVEKYLNGDSQNDFDIRVPLSEEIELKNSYIAVNSTITGLDNGYVKGGVLVNSKKEFGSNAFVTSIDFTAAELLAKAFDIEKKSNADSGLDLIVVVKDSQKIQLKNISLWKKEELEEKDANNVAEPKIQTAKISGDIEIETAPFKVSSLNFKNDNFGKNNYFLAYKIDPKTAGQKIFLKGEQLNLGAFVENKFFGGGGGESNFANSQIQIAVKNIELARNKSLKNFSVSLNCADGLCARGLIRGSYGKKQFINLRVVKNPRELSSSIEGRITDVGYLAEGLGISNTVSGGDAKVKLQNKIIDKKPFLEGKVTIDNNITIYENATVKRLSKNTLFSQVKDKIFSSEKTIFDNVKLEFDIQDNILNIRSLIANNYKIGITAKGVIDLKNDTYEIKGMIIPGFLINNLFGIGKIPILGNVISGLLTGGEGGGLFGIKYEYVKKKGQAEPTFETYKVSSFVPTTIKNLFDLI